MVHNAFLNFQIGPKISKIAILASFTAFFVYILPKEIQTTHESKNLNSRVTNSLKQQQ